VKEVSDEAIMKRREQQREYAKRTNYASQNKSNAKNTKLCNFRLTLSTDADIIKKLDSLDNVSGYIKALIRKDIEENGI